ncbi:tabersonine-19-hydroxy-O-acetyltransferase-like [Mangifera indica]|uniref:tabersonine-19-hydroxy-O-acetyltransferase-like n=1 Tax=Mangifera indica TaxID=29780 RepID=UPI001CFBA185|nr:tabersonine-19-hydroxy-O-acetyltransferase-like [Mangifera indica]
MIEMKSEILSRICIKPSSPTPSHLKTFKLSLLDQLSPPIHGNMTFFYTSNVEISSNLSQTLQDSLSQTLTLFYPLAGRLQDAATVDCNDEGVFFIEAQVNVQLSEFLSQPDFKLIDHLLPSTDSKTMGIYNGAMLLVQFTSFTCGGVAISLSTNHKLTDISALVTFLQSWTNSSHSFHKPVVPDFIGPNLLPARDDFPNMSASVNISAAKFTLRRFVFSGSKIVELKDRVYERFLQVIKRHPSRVEVVLALIWKCAMAANRSKSGSTRPSALFQAVNLRKRMTPPVPESAFGNFVWPFMVIAEEDNKDNLELHELVIEMRRAFNSFCHEKADKFKGEEGHLAILGALKERGQFFKNRKEMTVYKCTSWSKFPLYDTDFGWGKPVWHVSVNKMVSNTIALADTRSGDGIEAFITLDDEEMAIFERNEELLKYATLNPSIACA